MQAIPGMVVAVSTDDYEIHLADDGTGALIVYPDALCDHPERYAALFACLEGMGFGTVHELGTVDVDRSEEGLTGRLDWASFNHAGVVCP